MTFDFTPYFAKYEKLVAASDAAFERVKLAHAECVKCREGCADCCHAVFDLTLIEALYINHRFKQEFEGAARADLEEKANRTDRLMAKIKRRAQEELLAGRPEADILTDLARERVRCPLLDTKDLCELYRYRPLTCRFYGIPTAIGGSGHTCGLSDNLYLDEELSLRTLAEKTGLPSATVSQVLNERLKKNFYDFVNGFRVEEAKRILRDPRRRDQKILGIAFDTGFSSKVAFNRVFKKYAGMTPSEYRNQA